jgi:hypothetical protein
MREKIIEVGKEFVKSIAVCALLYGIFMAVMILGSALS